LTARSGALRDLLRESGGKEKVLKNAKDACLRPDREARSIDPRRRGVMLARILREDPEAHPTRSSAPTSTATRPMT
jgi:hypothetical protein